MSFRVLGLDPRQFSHLVGLGDEELAKHGARRRIVGAGGGIPDRISVREALEGESLILLNYVHQPADTPYRASHAIFVLESATERCDIVDEIPDLLKTRLISLRAFGPDHELKSADVILGDQLPTLIGKFFENDNVAYLHAHYAKPGCYAALIERA